MKTIDLNRYDELIEKIKYRIKSYEIALSNNKYYIGLANGDIINLTLPKNNIPHLLGINTDLLKTAGIIKKDMSPYDILKKLINYEITFNDMKKTYTNININDLFSEYIDSKIKIFNDILKIRSDDIYCVIKYRSDRSYTTGEEKENSDYFIIRKHEKKFSVLGIIKNEGYNNYVPVTARLYNNYDELREFLNKVAKNQEITYPYSFKIENYENFFSTKGYTHLEEKLELNKNLKDIAYKYGAIPSTNKDFIVILERTLNDKQKTNNSSSILSSIKDSIISKTIIEKEDIKQMLNDEEIPKELEQLIDASNDLICSNQDNDKPINNSYSSVQNENTKLKEELESLKKELLELKERTTKLEEENTNLTETNNNVTQKLKTLTDAFESIK
jgi:hypothetical protein